MSTSSGRKGSCTRCGHLMNEHAKSKEAKCKNCKKSFDICQVGFHGQVGYNPEGWRICFVPCNCGSEYYPDKARAARPLEPHEYSSGHPGYRPLEVETEVATFSDNEDVTDYEEVDFGEDEYSAANSPVTTRAGHVRYPSADSDDPITSTGSVGNAPVVSTQRRAKHVRYLSQSSDDPLAAMPEPQPVSDIANMLAGISLDASGSGDRITSSGPDVGVPTTLTQQRTKPRSHSQSSEDPLVAMTDMGSKGKKKHTSRSGKH